MTHRGAHPRRCPGIKVRRTSPRKPKRGLKKWKEKAKQVAPVASPENIPTGQSDQSRGGSLKGNSTSDKDLAVLFSRMHLEYESHKQKFANSEDSIKYLFSHLSVTDPPHEPHRGPSAGTLSLKPLYEPSSRVTKCLHRIRTQGFYSVAKVTSVLRLRNEFQNSHKVDVLADVYGLT